MFTAGSGNGFQHLINIDTTCSKIAVQRLSNRRGSWVVGRGSWVVGRGSWVVGRGSWVVGRWSWVPNPNPNPFFINDWKFSKQRLEILETDKT